MRRRYISAKYDRVAIVLHWAIALLMISAIVASEVMPQIGMRGFLYSLHASLGISVLMLSMVRCIWRLGHIFPGYPAQMPKWQKITAGSVCIVFYILMITIPLTGWISHSLDAVSRPFFINSKIFGAVSIPILPVDGVGLSTLLRSSELNVLHELSSNLMIGLIILHVGAAFKHHIVDRDDIMMRMLPDFGHDRKKPNDAK